MALSFFVAIICGLLSGLGVGGGSLLMVWMTAVLGMEQYAAQGINLLYFLPTAGASLLFHARNGLIDRNCALSAIPCGCVFAFAGALLAMQLHTALLQKLFGTFLLVVGVSEVKKAFVKPKKED